MRKIKLPFLLGVAALLIVLIAVVSMQQRIERRAEIVLPDISIPVD